MILEQQAASSPPAVHLGLDHTAQNENIKLCQPPAAYSVSHTHTSIQKFSRKYWIFITLISGSFNSGSYIRANVKSKAVMPSSFCYGLLQEAENF